MGKEIERKFIVARPDAVPPGWETTITQGYLNRSPDRTVRVRVTDAGKAWITIKGRAKGIARDEFEYPIPYEDGQHLIGMTEGRLIRKTRRVVLIDGAKWEVDFFAGDLAGLVLAEIELPSTDMEVALPSWLGRDVSEETRYTNSALAADSAPDLPEIRRTAPSA